jgi:hypothetical protein
MQHSLIARALIIEQKKNVCDDDDDNDASNTVRVERVETVRLKDK